ncbi:MAG: hypothetical protein ACN4GF_00735 [Lentimonas sp.]
MKYSYIQGTLTLLTTSILLSVFAVSTADARIGEGRESIERRLTSSGGIIYRDDKLEETRRKGMPYMKYMDFLGNSANVRIYFKSSDGRRATSSELEEKRVNAGWDLHIVYVNGKSVVELYKRRRSMSKYELNKLITLQGGGTGWKKVGKEDAEESAFGYEMESNDGSVRAKQLGGDRILFIDAKIDTGLAEMNANDLLEKAPISVEGF